LAAFTLRTALRPEDRLLLVLVEDPVRVHGEEVRVGEQPQHEFRGLDRRPHRLDGRLHRGVAGHGVLHPVVRRLPGPLHLHQHGMRDALRQGLAGGAVADVAVEQLPHDGFEFVRRDPPAA
jgi:hypothetical protein